MKSTLVALFLFLVLAAAFSWPLVKELPDRIPFGLLPTDPQALFYGVASGTQALLSHPLQYFDATFFYPYPSSLAFLDQIFGLCLLAAPVEAATGNPVLAYNAVWLATFVLSGLGAFLLVRFLTGSTAGGILAGLVYAFQPFRWHNEGAINAIAIHWIPFALLCLHRWVWTDRLRWFIGFVVFAMLQFLSSGYTGVFLLVTALLYLFTLVGADRLHLFGLLRSQRRWATLVVVLAAILLIPFVSPTLHNLQEGYGPKRSLGEAALWSARIPDFVTPVPGGVWDGILPAFGSARHPLFPGFVVLFLVWPWIARRAWRQHRHRVDLLFYMALLGAGLILSLGPALTIGGFRIPLPFALLHYLIPGASLMRAPVRFDLLAMLGLAVLAGVAFVDLMERKRLPTRPCLLWSSVVLVLAAAELYPGPRALFDPLPDEIPGVYRRLAEDPAPVVLAELPMPLDETREVAEDALPQLYSLIHGKRLVNGLAAYVPPITRELRILMQRFPEPPAVDRLRELGVDRVLLHLDRYDPEEAERLARAVEAAPGLEVLDREGPLWSIRVRGPETR